MPDHCHGRCVFSRQRALYAIGAALTVLCLVACSASTYNLPPVSADLDGARRPGKFVWHDLISDDVVGSERFYSGLLGWEFRSLKLLGAEYWVISHRGQPIGGMVNQEPIPARRDISQWVSVLASEDLEATQATVRDAGGEVLRAPVSLGERGRIAVFTDPQGALFAALQTPAGDPVDRDTLPAPGAFLWHELWTPEPRAAAGFYAALSGLSQESLDGETPDGRAVTYRVLRDGTHPRAGVRSLPAADIPPVWVPYVRVSDRGALDSLLAQVASLGGEVLVPATVRPAGGHMALIAGPSGAPLALQTWADGQAVGDTL
jgi:predicted enzyme related to lactoylglutathione lyase